MTPLLRLLNLLTQQQEHLLCILPLDWSEETVSKLQATGSAYESKSLGYFCSHLDENSHQLIEMLIRLMFLLMVVLFMIA